MSVKVNLKKYLARDGKWQFFPVLKIGGKLRPEAVLINGEPVKGTSGEVLPGLSSGRQTGTEALRGHSREGLDAWRSQQAILDGVIEAPEEDFTCPGSCLLASAVGTFLAKVSVDEGVGHLRWFRSYLNLFKEHVRPRTVGKVTREDSPSPR